MDEGSFSIKRICLVQYGVKELARKVDWFTEVLGFRRAPVPHDVHGKIVNLVQNECRVLLHPDPKPSSLDYLGESNTLIVFEVEDLNKAIGQLKKRGVQFTGEPQHFHLGRFVTFQDPFGKTLELVEFHQ